MDAFTYEALPGRVIFGSGTLARVAEEVRALGCRRVIVLSTPEQRGDAEALAARLGDLAAGLFSGAAMHTPVEVTKRALEIVRQAGAGCTVALGGGSTTGLGKAIALRTDLPQIVIPTNYAGSEATPILGETEHGRKVTQRTLKVLPEVIIYDVELTLSLPASLSATSGMNAIAHAVEALYARDSNPVINGMAEQGIAALARALPTIRHDPSDRAARSDALFGAWACGVCLGAVGMSLHHKLCHTLGGSFDLPHAPTHTVVLPHAAAFNAPAAPDAMARAAKALDVQDAPAGLFDLARSLGAPTSLRELGVAEGELDRVADLATTQPYWNPRPVDRRGIRALLDDAWHGRRPGSR
ncbi:maleylacetate reductase [Roseomonas chloroacetimidivorans]|uniref:maleylacetate reductase n=1 Tax=Roseomonas chloroacetimidivorans TaxID=1766656 RepID=UPI003C713189